MKNEKMTKEQLVKELAKLRSEITQVKEETELKKEEEIVVPSEKSFQNLIESFNEVIYRADPNTFHTTFVNRSIEKLYGYTVEEWISNPDLWVQTIHPDDKEYVFNAVSEAHRNFVNTVLEYRIIRKDGGLRWIQDNISWERDHMGNISSVIGVTYDITENKQNLNKLFDSEEKYRSFVQNFQGIAFQGDLNFTPRFFHGVVKEITGYNEDDFTSGKPRWDQIIHPDDLPEFLSVATEKIKSAQEFSTDREFRIIRKDGKIRWVRERVQSICDNSRKPIYVQGTIHDITDRKNVENELKFRSGITEQLNVSVLATGLDFKINWVNEAFCFLYGYTSEEVIGQTPDFLNIDPLSEEIQNDIYQTVSSGRVWSGEAMNRRKDGTIFPCELDIFPLKDKNENIFAYVGHQRDITERKNAEILLLNEKKFTETAIDTQIDTFFLFEPNTGKAIRWNNQFQKITGYSNEEISAMKAPDSYYSQEDLEKAKDTINDVISQGLGKVEISLICKDGRRIPFEYVVSAIRDNENKIKYLISIGRDITEHKKAEKEQERLNAELNIKNKELEQVLYVTSHDLRSPLVNVEGFGMELEYSLKDLMSSIDHADVPSSVKDKITPIVKKDIPESLHYIKTSVSKMSTLLKGILTLSRLGSAELMIAEIDMNEMMNEIVDNHIFRLNELKIKTEVSKLPNCRGDSSQINQVFSNLLDNAIKYTDLERPGVIHISGYKDKNQSVYCIEDNGLGIAPEHQDKIFEIFHQLEPNRIKGDGLGLTIANRILEKHNGKIWIESELGKGSKFCVSLPS